ncbi:RodZ family helix-turn-helix domain-containing protein [Gordonibacter sp. Marseille-P4307]|uniref:helix-turn-helix domain-containing protein n=1 Tax=Gordonibacter sp. Marseille-P4307 TaxID=2161815 RepID=UPI000F54A40F|nr:helix-turn-helix transcriptional regulator [Gordonibacter sp. Marseille-P4307]
MSKKSSGAVLREARERQGLDLATVARRLRIRADILRSIEGGDFSVMPPRGYTRNMVNAYARLLGLNPTDIVNQYLEEAYANQVERARTSSTGRRFDMSSPENRRSSRRARRDDDGFSSEPERRRSALGRDLYDDRTEFARADYGLNGAVRRTRRSAPEYDDDYGFPASRSRTPRATNHKAVPNSYTNLVSSPAVQGALHSRLPFVIGGVVALAVIIVILVMLFGHKSASNAAVDTLPITGISDTTGEDESSSDTAAPAPAPVETAPTSVSVSYAVEGAGQACYIETYVDGKLENAQTLIGPTSQNVSVTGTWVITTWAADALKLTVDGKEVSLASDPNYNGMYSYTVNFPQILEEWNKAHGIATPSSSTAASTNGSAGSTGSKGAAAGGSTAQSSGNGAASATSAPTSGSVAAVVQQNSSGAQAPASH